MQALRLYYGGTFDPVHDGHLAIARAAHATLGVPVRMMPAADPPHRGMTGASAEHRVAMLRLAIADAPDLLLDCRELEREGPSWTVDTLRALRREFGDVPIALLVGADSFRTLPTWRAWRELPRLAHFVVAGRPEHSLDEDLPAELAEAVANRVCDRADALEEAPAGRVLLLQQALHAHSASDIRHRIAGGLPWRHLVPPKVADYILAHGLYGVTTP